jgi:hypothetical protein
MGADTSMVVSIACRPISVTVSIVMRGSLLLEASDHGSDDEIPAVGKHEQRISLNGSEIITGGRSIMPMDISTLATTISTIRKGM